MSERRLSTDGIERRGFLSAVAVGLGGTGLGSVTADSSESTDPTYVVEQGDRCLPVVPLSGDETVEEFYDYRTPDTDPSGPYSSSGTTHLQRPETSILFLYDGPEGLSLVVVHDELEDGTNGGAVTFRLEGHTDGEWVVGDDDYDAPTNYDRFQETDDGWRIDWTWTTGRSDGGAYRPLGDEFAVTVDPAFNEDAELYGDPYEGEITDWELLSGDRSDPERRSLSLTEPITIRTGGCGGTAVGAEADASSGSVRADVTIEQGRVNPRSRGALPVAVRSTASFDATTVDLASVDFGPADATPEQWSHTDVNGDGRTDLLLKFRLPATGIDWETEEAPLSAETTDGRPVEGAAEVRLVPRRDKDDEDDDDGDETERDDGADDDDDASESDDDDEDEREEWEEKREEKEEKLEEKKEEMEEKWEEKEEKFEEKYEEMEEKREEKEEKLEEKREEMEEKWEKKKEKWEKKRDDEDDD